MNYFFIIYLILIFYVLISHRLISAYNNKVITRKTVNTAKVAERYGDNVTFTQFIEFIVTESRVKCR